MKIPFNFLLALFIFLLSPQIHAQLVINEFFITNGSADLSTSTYNYMDWIEIYNPAESAGSTQGLYLSDDKSKLKKWPIPNSSVQVNEYKIYFFSELGKDIYTNFKADADKGSLYLSNSNGKIVDEVNYDRQYYNASYGRYPNGNGSFHYMLEPTRGTENNASIAEERAISIVFDKKGGFYNAPITVSMLNTLNGNIYYTLNGSEPNENSKIYKKPLTISSTTIVRARIIEEGKVPGEIATHSYFIGTRKPKIPIISIVTDSLNLFDNTIGIYTTGTNGIVGNCSDIRRNWNRDWERSANFELFDTSYKQVFDQMLGIKIAGACSRGNGLKSLSLHARGKYGNGRMNHKFFQDRTFDKFNSILLRTAANDLFNSLCRDMIFQKLTDRFMNIDHQAFQPATFYLNGAYYGMLSIYERSGEDLVEASYGLEQDAIDMGEADGINLQGDVTDYRNLLSFINTNSLAVEANYNQVASQIDIDNYIDYLILQMYIGNTDWPGNNCKFWRKKEPKSKWRWILFDTDFGFEIYGPDQYNQNMFATMMDSNSYSWPNNEWATRLFRKLTENPGFKKTFVNRFYAHINSTFKPELVIKTIDSVANIVSNEVPYHAERWGGPGNWSDQIQFLRNYAISHPETVRSQLREFAGADSDVVVKYHSAGEGLGYISFDNVPSADTAYSGIFAKGTITNIRFNPAPGYVFDKAYKTVIEAGTSMFVKLGDTWKYYDADPALVDSNWFKTDFNDINWNIGTAQFGYGEGDENTVISYGPGESNKYITSYYRKYVDFDTSRTYESINLKLLVDDGAVVYINGKEVFRQNLQTGPVNYLTLAANANENVYAEAIIPDSFFVHGANCIAVEVHQSSASSSDVSFDLQLSSSYTSHTQSTVEINAANFTDTLHSSFSYQAYYKACTPISHIIINEVAPRNKLFMDEYDESQDWIELYNNSNDSLSLSGLFLTDSIDFLTKYMIPFVNGLPLKIAPFSYQLIWADGQPKKGPFHTNFSLNKLSEEVGLFQKVGDSVILLDSVSYVLTKKHQSAGRYPNITGSFKNLYHATPDSDNVDLPYVEEPDEITTFENQTADIWYRQTSNSLMIHLKEPILSDAVFSLFDMTGREISINKLKDSISEIHLSGIQKGIYIAVVRNKQFFQSQKLVLF